MYDFTAAILRRLENHQGDFALWNVKRFHDPDRSPGVNHVGQHPRVICLAWLCPTVLVAVPHSFGDAVPPQFWWLWPSRGGSMGVGVGGGCDPAVLVDVPPQS